MEASIIDQGVELMMYGMGTVFVFLVVLIFVTFFMSKIVQSMPEAASPQVSAPAPAASADTSLTTDVRKAIQAAIHEHRKQK